jgi:hypothetical protein
VSRSSLSDLLEPGLDVPFDLDGDGAVERWPWVKPDTGILVWDPDHRAEITSGLQLFGSVTWWMFFADGYHALDALDDDRDGRLRGRELAGLGVWFDRNGDGRSEPGEVVPVERLGIYWIATHATSRDGDSPANLEGLGLDDGRVLPTYDWTTSPAAHVDEEAKTFAMFPRMRDPGISPWSPLDF